MSKTYLLLLSMALLLAACIQKPVKTEPRVLATKTDSLKAYDSIKNQMALLDKQSPSATPKTNYVDGNGLRQGHWVLNGEMEHAPGYKSNEKVEDGDYYFGKKQGMWVEYLPGAIIKDTVFYKDNNIVKSL